MPKIQKRKRKNSRPSRAKQSPGQAKLRPDRELNRARADLDRLSRRLDGLFNAVPVGCAILDGRVIIREINEAGAALLRRSRKRLINESLARFVPNESLAAFLNHFRICKTSHGGVTTELVLRAADGAFVPVELVSCPFVTPGRRA